MPEIEQSTEPKAWPQIPVYQPSQDEKWIEHRLGKTSNASTKLEVKIQSDNVNLPIDKQTPA